MDGETRAYSYPLSFQMMWGKPFLVLGVIMALSVAAWFLWLGQILSAAAAVIAYTVGLVVGTRRILRHVPYLITVRDDLVSVHCLWLTQSFKLADVRRVDTNCRTPVLAHKGGAAQITYVSNGEERTLFIAPYISSYAELLRVLSGVKEEARPARAQRVFSLTRSAVREHRFIFTLLPLGFIVMGAAAVKSVWEHAQWLAPVVAIGFAALLCYLARHASSLATGVRLRDDVITVTNIFDAKITVNRRDVIRIADGNRSAGFRYGVAGKTILRRNGKPLYIDPSFVDYPELIATLNQWAAGPGTVSREPGG